MNLTTPRLTEKCPFTASIHSFYILRLQPVSAVFWDPINQLLEELETMTFWEILLFAFLTAD